MPASRKASETRSSRKSSDASKHEPDATLVIEICKTGDVILVCGEDKQKFRVSSQMLRASSEVFNRMFSLDFAEGQNLTASQPKEIQFPDDDPEAMAILCNIIHLNNDNTPDRLGSFLLVTIGRLIDKYDLHRTTHLAMDVWLSIGSLPAVLLVSQILQNEKHFRAVTKKLIFDSLDDFQKIAGQYPDENLFPALFQMERVRNIYRTSIREVIECEAGRYFEGQENKQCKSCLYQETMGLECRNLAQQCVHIIGSYTLTDIVDRINKMPRVSKDFWVDRRNCLHHVHLTTPISLRLWKQINEWGDSAECCEIGPEKHGLCLSCTQAGRPTAHTESEPCPMKCNEDFSVC